MIKATGKIQVKNGIRIVLDIDFCRYYLWLWHQHIYKTKKYQLPAHGAHVSIVLPNIHGITDYRPYSYLHGKTVEFEYSTNIFVSKINLFLPVCCEWADEFRIKNKISITTFSGTGTSLHLTIGNRKNL